MKDIEWSEIGITAGVILIPSWTTAYITEQIIYVIPMLAVCTFIVAQVFSHRNKRLEDDFEGGIGAAAKGKEEGGN